MILTQGKKIVNRNRPCNKYAQGLNELHTVLSGGEFHLRNRTYKDQMEVPKLKSINNWNGEFTVWA